MKTIKSTLALLKNSKRAKETFLSYSYLGLVIVLLFSLESCNPEDEVTEPAKTEIFSGEQLQQTIQDNREDAMQHFTITADMGGTLHGEQGTILTFFPNSITKENGEAVVGEIDIDLIEIYDKATMVMTKMPTNGKRDNGNVETLVSAGEFFINATQNGEQLKPSSGFRIFSPNDVFDPEMIVFKGVDDDCDQADAGLQCDIEWEEDEKAELGRDQAEGPNGQGVSGYGGFMSNFGWANLDRWYSDPRPKTILYADVPEGYDDTNSNVYISYDGEPTALALLDVYNTDTGLFSEHYGQIPIGLEIHFIFVSVQDDQYVYAIQGATVGEDHIEVIGTTTTGTEAELVALINDLP